MIRSRSLSEFPWFARAPVSAATRTDAGDVAAVAIAAPSTDTEFRRRASTLQINPPQIPTSLNLIYLLARLRLRFNDDKMLHSRSSRRKLSFYCLRRLNSPEAFGSIRVNWSAQVLPPSLLTCSRRNKNVKRLLSSRFRTSVLPSME